MLLRIEGEVNQSAKAEEEINKCRRIRQRYYKEANKDKIKN